MKLFASSILLSLCLILLPPAPDSGRVRCKCRPSPPGGVTECESGQIAVCNSSGGVCKGSCISANAQLQPLQYSAALLTQVLDRDVSIEDLRKDPKASKRNFEALLKSSRDDKPVKLKYKGKEYIVSVGLTEVAINKLKAAGGALAINNRLHIPVPIGIGHP
jgi:hypothetical protein